MSTLDQSSWRKYYKEAIILLDGVIQSRRLLTEEEIDRLDFLAEHGNFNVKEIAELNDCGKCDTWNDIVRALKR